MRDLIVCGLFSFARSAIVRRPVLRHPIRFRTLLICRFLLYLSLYMCEIYTLPNANPSSLLLISCHILQYGCLYWIGSYALWLRDGMSKRAYVLYIYAHSYTHILSTIVPREFIYLHVCFCHIESQTLLVLLDNIGIHAHK